MMNMKSFLGGAVAFFQLSLAVSAHGAQNRVPYHPLDALTTNEYWTVHDVLQQSGHLSPKTLYLQPAAP